MRYLDPKADPQIRKAVTALEESAFTEEQLLGYEKFWDIISVEKTLINSAERKGRKAGMEEGVRKQNLSNAQKLKQLGVSVDIIAQATGLSIEKIEGA